MNSYLHLEQISIPASAIYVPLDLHLPEKARFVQEIILQQHFDQTHTAAFPTAPGHVVLEFNSRHTVVDWPLPLWRSATFPPGPVSWRNALKEPPKWGQDVFAMRLPLTHHHVTGMLRLHRDFGQTMDYYIGFNYLRELPKQDKFDYATV